MQTAPYHKGYLTTNAVYGLCLAAKRTRSDELHSYMYIKIQKYAIAAIIWSPKVPTKLNMET